uniref:S1 motif domain-containing protein n=1 Tax=Globodera pallida TaxID=36090 RepID=A0A183CM51_GLOPA
MPKLAQPVESKRSNIESDDFKVCRGLVVDASLKDAFFVHCANFTEMVSLRKDITDGQIAVGDWIEFVAVDVQEAVKYDDQLQIFPTDTENMLFFLRKIACFPSKIEPVLRTSVNGGNVQLFVDIEVPVNPTHKGCYAVEQLGQVCDPRGLIGVKHELLTISVIVQCHVDVELKSMALNIHEIANVSEPQLPPAPPVEQYRGHFLENIERSQQQKQQTRRIRPLAAVGTASTTAAAAAERDENVDPNMAFRHQPLQAPPLVAPPPLRRKPTNSIELETIVVEAVTGRGAQSPHVFCFCFDCSQKSNNYIIRIGLKEMDQLPTIGQWVRVVMKQEFHGKRVDYSLWEAQVMEKAPFETDFSIQNGVRTVLVRVLLKVSNDGYGYFKYYNQSLGLVSDLEKRLNVPAGYERRVVKAWCRKIMPSSLCVDGVNHWEIAPLPEEEWQDEQSLELPPERKATFKLGQDEQSLELPPERKATFKLGFVGSRYRSSTAVQQQTTTAQTGRLLTIAATTIPAVHPPPPAPQQKPQVIAVGKPNSGARISPAMDSSGFGSSTSSNNSQQNSAEAELDLIDLFDEKCSIGKPKAASPPLLQPQHQFDGAVFPHTGVIASVDLKSSGGYYVYSNEFDSELYLPAEGELEQGTWIKFNILDTTYRPTVGQYALLKRSPFDVRVERNTICMRVRATITNEALVTRVVKTSYVNQVYDRNRLLQPSHLNKELQLEVRRGKFDGFYWAIGKIMMLVA